MTSSFEASAFHGGQRMTPGPRLRSAVAALLLSVPSACSDDATGVDASYVETFDRFWETFDADYSYFEYKQIDWDSLRDVYRPQADGVGSVLALVELLREMTAPLRDLHVWFTRPNGVAVGTWQPTRQRNWVQSNWLGHMSRYTWVQGTTNWGHASIEGVPYVAIGAWNADQVRIADIDAALELFREAPALIIDVRMNPGGNDALAYQVAGRFTSTSVVAEHFRFRNGSRHDDFTELTTKRLEPRGTWQFTRPVVVLVGAGSFSSNESFISAMRELPHVTIMGDTTGGATGNPGFHDLREGWRFTVPRWIAYTADLQVIEWQGIAPDVQVPVRAEDFIGDVDPVIDAARTWLREHADIP